VGVYLDHEVHAAPNHSSTPTKGGRQKINGVRTTTSEAADSAHSCAAWFANLILGSYYVILVGTITITSASHPPHTHLLLYSMPMKESQRLVAIGQTGCGAFFLRWRCPGDHLPVHTRDEGRNRPCIVIMGTW